MRMTMTLEQILKSWNIEMECYHSISAMIGSSLNDMTQNESEQIRDQCKYEGNTHILRNDHLRAPSPIMVDTINME